MKIGSTEMYLTHPQVIIGSPGEADWRLELGTSSAVASQTHVIVGAVAQMPLVRVSIWNKIGLCPGERVFGANLTLPDGRLVVRDTLAYSSFERELDERGPQRLDIFVDEPHIALRVDVVVGGHDSTVALPSVPGFELPPVFGATELPEWPSQLGLALSGHDIPVARLATGAKILASASLDGSDVQYGYSMVAQWLRGLGPKLSFESCSAAAQQIKRQLDGVGSSAVDERALSTAIEAIKGLARLEV